MIPALTFEAVPFPGAFETLGEAWRRLLASSDADTIFLTPEWMEAWWRAYGEGRRGGVVAVRRSGDLVALLPIQVAPERWRGVTSVRALRFAGDGTFDSDYLDLVAGPDAGEDLVPALWRWIRRDARLGFDVARWNEIPAASPRLEPLRAALRRDGSWIDEERVGAVVAALPGSWETYLASLKPRMRTKVRSLRRDLEAAHSVKLLAADSDAVLPERLASLFDLHQKRWAARGLPGVFRGDRKRSFYHGLSSTLLARGWLQFHSLEVDGAWVAHQYCMGYRGTIFLLQEGYDPAWEPRGVGNVLRAMVLERLIGEGWRAYDFLAGVTEHKKSWSGETKESLRLFARGPGLRGAGVAALERLAAAAGPLRRAVRSAPA